jgi:hypothetical protein
MSWREDGSPTERMVRQAAISLGLDPERVTFAYPAFNHIVVQIEGKAEPWIAQRLGRAAKAEHPRAEVRVDYVAATGCELTQERIEALL